MCPRVSPRCALITISRDRPMKPRGTRGCDDRVYLNPVKRTFLIDDRVDLSPRDGCFEIISDAHCASTLPTKEGSVGT